MPALLGVILIHALLEEDGDDREKVPETVHELDQVVQRLHRTTRCDQESTRSNGPRSSTEVMNKIVDTMDVKTSQGGAQRLLQMSCPLA